MASARVSPRVTVRTVRCRGTRIVIRRGGRRTTRHTRAYHTIRVPLAGSGVTSVTACIHIKNGSHRAFHSQRKHAQVCDQWCDYCMVHRRGHCGRQTDTCAHLVRFDTGTASRQRAGTRDGPRRSERYGKAAHDAVTLCARMRKNGSLIGEAHTLSSKSAVTTLTAECSGP